MNKKILLFIINLILLTQLTTLALAGSGNFYANWELLGNPLSILPRTEFDFTQMSMEEIQQYWGLAENHGSSFSDGAKMTLTTDGLKVYSTAYRGGALIYTKFKIPPHIVYQGLVVEAIVKLNSNTKRFQPFPQLVFPYNPKKDKSILLGQNYGYTNTIVNLYGGYTNGYRNAGMWYYDPPDSTSWTFHNMGFYPRNGVTYCTKTIYYSDQIIMEYYQSDCQTLIKKMTYNVPQEYVGKYFDYYPNDGYKEYPGDKSDLRIVVGVADDYGKNGFVISKLRIYYEGSSIYSQKEILNNLLKQPDFIELMNGGTESITYSEFSHSLTVYNPNDYDLSDYQVKIIITEADVGNQFFWVKEGSIRLYDSNGVELPYWVESWDSYNKEAVIWTKVPNIPAGGSVQLTLKSSIAYDDKSNGELVFEAFDDFNTKDTNKWNWPSDWIVEYGYLKQTYSSDWPPSGEIWSIKQMSISITNNYGAVIETYAKNLGTVSAYDMKIFWDNDADHTTYSAVSFAVDSHDKWIAWGTESTKTNWGEPDEKSWHLYQVIILNGDWRLLIDNKQYSSYPGSISQLEAIGLCSKGQSYWEWVRVRKFADEEPIAIFGDSLQEYTHTLTVYNPNSYDLIDYQVKIIITGADVGSQFYWNNRGSIRLYDSNGVELPYWVEEWDAENRKAVIWTKVSIPAGGSVQLTLKSYLLYDDKSNGGAVFEFFDDFETWEGWVKYGSGKVSQDSAKAYDGQYSAHKTSNNDPNGAYKEIGKTLGRDIILEFWVYRPSSYSGGNSDRIGLVDANGNGYGWVYNHGADNIGVDKRTSYDGSASATKSVSDYKNKWVFGRLIIKSDGTVTTQLYYNGGKVGETSLTNSNYLTFSKVYIFGGYDYWVDQIRIRKYADQEPTVTFVS